MGLNMVVGPNSTSLSKIRKEREESSSPDCASEEVWWKHPWERQGWKSEGRWAAGWGEEGIPGLPLE